MAESDYGDESESDKLHVELERGFELKLSLALIYTTCYLSTINLTMNPSIYQSV